MKVELASIIGVGQFVVGVRGVQSIDVRGEAEDCALVTVETKTGRLVLNAPWESLTTSKRGWHKKEESDEPAGS